MEVVNTRAIAQVLTHKRTQHYLSQKIYIRNTYLSCSSAKLSALHRVNVYTSTGIL